MIFVILFVFVIGLGCLDFYLTKVSPYDYGLTTSIAGTVTDRNRKARKKPVFVEDNSHHLSKIMTDNVA